MGTWYPKKGDIEKYSYDNNLKTSSWFRALSIYRDANEALYLGHQNLQAKKEVNDNYARLDALWKKEREIEKAFISKYLKIQLDFHDSNETTLLIQNINAILQDKKIYENSLKSILQLEEGNKGFKGKQNELYAFTNFILPKVIEKSANEYLENYYISQKKNETIFQELSQYISNAVINAINEELNKTLANDNLEIYKDFKEFLDRTDKEAFFKEILNGYGISKEKLLESFLSKQKKVKNKINKKEIIKSSLKGKAKMAGNVNEIFSGKLQQMMLDSFKNNEKIKVVVNDTGSLGMMKADHIISMGELAIDIEEIQKAIEQSKEKNEEGEKSIRIRNINALETLLENLSEVKNDLVFISDKNYSLTSQSFAENSKHYGGFAAETPNLVTLEKVLKKGQFSGDIEKLIFVLANSGDSVINGYDVQDALRIVALNIAKFLFDDIVVTEALDDYKSSLNKIHIFLLDNIYVPLSVFLEAAAEAFKKNSSEFEKYIKIDFSAGKTERGSAKLTSPENQLTSEDWQEYRNLKMKKNTLTIHFFGDFINFIKEYLG